MHHPSDVPTPSLSWQPLKQSSFTPVLQLRSSSCPPWLPAPHQSSGLLTLQVTPYCQFTLLCGSPKKSKSDFRLPSRVPSEASSKRDFSSPQFPHWELEEKVQRRNWKPAASPLHVPVCCQELQEAGAGAGQTPLPILGGSPEQRPCGVSAPEHTQVL